MPESDIRFTPQHVLDVVRAFDRIALDPCTTPDNPVGADRFYTEADDGLNQWWQVRPAPGIAFLNPPYSRGQLLRWADRVAVAWAGVEGVESIMLVPADTSTEATQFMLDHANAVAFWDKRICFAGTAGAKFANAFFYWGERQGRFKRVFSPHAHVLVLR